MFFSTLAGVFTNIQFKRVPSINFLTWNKYLRYAVRIPVFFLPYKSNLDLVYFTLLSTKELPLLIKYTPNTGDALQALKKRGKLFKNFNFKRYEIFRSLGKNV